MLQFRNLTVWQKGMDLAVRVYVETERFPRSEMYGLTAQIRKAVVSIPSNIAEGKAVGGQSYPHHIKIALGSEAELQTQVELAKRLKFLTERNASELIDHISEVGRMLVALLQSLPRDRP
jgi:four helix bundle protein